MAESQGEIVENKVSFFKSILSFESGEKISKYSDAPLGFSHEAILNCKNCQWPSLVCVAALSSVTGCCVNSVCSPLKNVKLFPIFIRKFTPQSKTNNESFTLLWTTTGNEKT